MCDNELGYYRESLHFIVVAVRRSRDRTGRYQQLVLLLLQLIGPRMARSCRDNLDSDGHGSLAVVLLLVVLLLILSSEVDVDVCNQDRCDSLCLVVAFCHLLVRQRYLRYCLLLPRPGLNWKTKWILLCVPLALRLSLWGIWRVCSPPQSRIARYVAVCKQNVVWVYHCTCCYCCYEIALEKRSLRVMYWWTVRDCLG